LRASHIVALAQAGGGTPPVWSPARRSPPFLRLFCGLYPYVLPYATRWRGGIR
jgi:hypothetical protein